MANIWYTTHKLHSYVFLWNEDRKCKLQKKFKSSIWLTASPLAVSQVHHLLSIAFSAATKNDLTEPTRDGGPTCRNPYNYGRG